MTVRDDGRSGPLDGLRVVDLSTVFAAPYVGAILRDMGAEVIKVEAPNRLDQTRGDGFGPYLDNQPGDDGWNWSGTFLSLNRGKKSLVLDLKQEQGRAVLRQLIDRCDVLLENFTPRVMRGWRMTWSDLVASNPGLIMLSNTGYGGSGPYSSFKAQGTVLEATMGIVHFCGYDGDEPRKVGQSYPDFLAAWTGLHLIASALVQRRANGSGRWIDLGMYQLGSLVIPEGLIEAQAGRSSSPRRGNDEIDTLLSAVIPCAGVDEWIAVSVVDDLDWARLASLVPDFPKLPPGQERDPSVREQALAALAAWAAGIEGAALAEDLQNHGIAASKIATMRDILTDRHLRARGFWEAVEVRPGDRRPVIGRAYTWRGRSMPIVRGRGPLFGEQNDEILADLGLTPAERDSLRAQQVVVDAPVRIDAPRPADVEVLLAAGVYRQVDPEYRRVLTSLTGADHGEGDRPAPRHATD